MHGGPRDRAGQHEHGQEQGKGCFSPSQESDSRGPNFLHSSEVSSLISTISCASFKSLMLTMLHSCRIRVGKRRSVSVCGSGSGSGQGPQAGGAGSTQGQEYTAAGRAANQQISEVVSTCRIRVGTCSHGVAFLSCSICREIV